MEYMKPKQVPTIRDLQAIRRTKDGQLQVSILCTDVDRTRASGYALLPDGQKERCNWLPSGKPIHDNSGRFDLDFSTL